MKQLLIMRHAKSDWSVEVPDFDRLLNPRGKRDAPFMGKLVNLIPDIILSSPAIRAKKTATGFAQACRYEKEIVWLDNFYHGTEIEIIDELKKLDNKIETAMVVGHNETLEILISALLSKTKIKVFFPTAAVALLTFEKDEWSKIDKATACLHWILHPKSFKNF
jgi:phosphohistidine phosphatase